MPPKTIWRVGVSSIITQTQTITGEFLMMDHDLWQISNDPPWDPENMKLVAIIQDNGSGDIYQSMELNVNDFDIDNDGVPNQEDNCFFVYNPNQQARMLIWQNPQPSVECQLL